MRAVDAVAVAVAAEPDATFVSSLGTATSALRAASGDSPHLYLGGAMGCGLATALGVADALPDVPIVAVVGDGDLLMGPGALWSLAGLAPQNLAVLVLANDRYGITGGQQLIRGGSFAAVAEAFAELTVAVASTAEEVEQALRELARPAVVVADVDDDEWPGPSPFIDAIGARRDLLARLRA
jgi:thiamine pyrophosphate-dependent acetolactate synthase large subunit-like protein